MELFQVSNPTLNTIKAETSTGDKSSRDDIMSVLLTFEKKESGANKSLLPDSDEEDAMPNISQNGSQRQEDMEVDEGSYATVYFVIRI